MTTALGTATAGDGADRFSAGKVAETDLVAATAASRRLAGRRVGAPGPTGVRQRLGGGGRREAIRDEAVITASCQYATERAVAAAVARRPPIRDVAV